MAELLGRVGEIGECFGRDGEYADRLAQRGFRTSEITRELLRLAEKGERFASVASGEASARSSAVMAWRTDARSGTR